VHGSGSGNRSEGHDESADVSVGSGIRTRCGRARMEAARTWVLAASSGVPHSEAKLMDFVSAICGADRENAERLFDESDRIRRVLCNFVRAERCE